MPLYEFMQTRIPLTTRPWARPAIRFISLIALLSIAGTLCFAGSARTPVKGIPKVGGGREVERFVLMETVHISHPNMRRADAMEYWMLPGQFVPVSEDGEGVYYQATSGFRIFRGSLGQKVTSGGLYVSKSRSDRIQPYVGDAKEPGEALNLDTFALLLDVRMKLKVARAERKG
jgi:hypothetical protein